MNEIPMHGQNTKMKFRHQLNVQSLFALNIRKLWYKSSKIVFFNAYYYKLRQTCQQCLNKLVVQKLTIYHVTYIQFNSILYYLCAVSTA